MCACAIHFFASDRGQRESEKMIFLRLFVMALVLYPGQSQEYNCSGSEYNHIPDSSDLQVECGVGGITLEVDLCSAEWAGFDHSMLALNGQHNNSLCKGVNDTSVDPPVIRYFLPINDSTNNPCRQSLKIVDEEPGAGVFSSFSMIQSMIISGYIDTPHSAVGLISYSTDLFYHFSCKYPMKYLLNNTEITSSSVSVANSDSNGTFIDTLSMSVYNDSGYEHPLVVPQTGLELRTRVYVEVKATNLTGNFHVLLDHCFATPTPFNMSHSEKHNFFTGCTSDVMTEIVVNGVQKLARFIFEAFRFVQHRNLVKSHLYIHCILRICEPRNCQKLLDACQSRRRAADADAEAFGPPAKDYATVSVGPLTIRHPVDAAVPLSDTAIGEGPRRKRALFETNVTGLMVGLIIGCAGVALLVLGGWFALKKFRAKRGLPHLYNYRPVSWAVQSSTLLFPGEEQEETVTLTPRQILQIHSAFTSSSD